ncbi:hypothetical protein KGF54_002406 [Candida jiufengensis]|uniref:uncharacterized protein n=1 Tax=Candida jiufengensis TaxID=497108 RepID=UPI002224315C|nr:uncharacterized protein KGF54_002406 [Candida jiufengensis]KAI5954630.1 hypothetical protein KGF54_002406 [Candida jiufengensis]
MFKTSSYFIPTWFKKQNLKESTTSIDPSTIPKSFNISNDDNKLINILMKEQNDEEEEEFIDIQTKQLSYAEVALLGQNKKQSNNYLQKSKPSRGLIEKNQFNVLQHSTSTSQSLVKEQPKKEELENLEDSLTFEQHKSNDEYSKSLNYKNKQYKTIKDKKLKSKNFKKESKKINTKE